MVSAWHLSKTTFMHSCCCEQETAQCSRKVLVGGAVKKQPDDEGVHLFPLFEPRHLGAALLPNVHLPTTRGRPQRQKSQHSQVLSSRACGNWNLTNLERIFIFGTSRLQVCSAAAPTHTGRDPAALGTTEDLSYRVAVRKRALPRSTRGLRAVGNLVSTAPSGRG